MVGAFDLGLEPEARSPFDSLGAFDREVDADCPEPAKDMLKDVLGEATLFSTRS
jgi:hypothetical protein